MSCFQFKSYLVPNGQEKIAIKCLFDEDVDENSPRLNYKMSRMLLSERISDRLLLRDQWGETFEYGIDNDDEIRIYTSKDKDTIDFVEARINCIKDFRPFLQYICELTLFMNCKILYERNRVFYDPDYEVMHNIVNNSWSRMMAQDPLSNIPLAAEECS